MKAINSTKKLVLVCLSGVAILLLNSVNVRAQKPKPAEDACTECEVKLAALEKQIAKLRYLAQGKAMALKSLDLWRDPEQRALVALTAYKFNRNNNGNPDDNDIYNALFTSLKQLNDPLTRGLSGHNPGIAQSLVVNTQTGQMISGASDGRILRWTLKEGNWNYESVAGQRKDFFIQALAVSSDGNWLIAGGTSKIDTKEGYLELYDLKDLTIPPKKIKGFAPIESVFYDTQNRGAYIKEQEGNDILYTDFVTTKKVIQLKEKTNALSISPDGLQLAGASVSGNLYLWDISDNFKERIAYKNNDELTAITFSPQSERLIFGDKSGLVKIISLRDRSQSERILSGHEGQIEQIIFNHAGSRLVTASRDGSLRIWNWKALHIAPIVQRMEDTWTWSAVITPDDKQLMIGPHYKVTSSGNISIPVWPLSIETMAAALCAHLSRNMTIDEWYNFAGPDLIYEKTCEK